MAEAIEAEVTVAIRSVAYQASGKLRQFGYERQDLEQEFALHYLQHRHQFNSSRARPATFASHICRMRTLGILEQATARKRGAGVTFVSLSEAVTADKSYMKAERPGAKSGELPEIRSVRRVTSEADLLVLRIDVDRVVQALPPELTDLAHLMLDGESINDMMRITGVSRATLHRRMARLQTAFRKVGLLPNAHIQEAA